MSDEIIDVEGEGMNGPFSGIAIIARRMAFHDRTTPEFDLPGPDQVLQDTWMIAQGLKSPVERKVRHV